MKKNKKIEDLIEKGMLRYVLMHGVIGWGVLTALLFSAFMHFSSNEPFLMILSKAIIMFPIGGIFWGVIMWFFLKRTYAKSNPQ